MSLVYHFLEHGVQRVNILKKSLQFKQHSRETRILRKPRYITLA